MSTRLQTAIDETEDFWQPKTLDQLLQAQQTSPVADIDELAVDFQPDEESVSYRGRSVTGGLCSARQEELMEL